MTTWHYTIYSKIEDIFYCYIYIYILDISLFLKVYYIKKSWNYEIIKQKKLNLLYVLGILIEN